MKPVGNLWQQRLRFDMRAALVIIAVIALVPLVVSGPYTLGIILVSMYFAILALAWNLLAGYTGQSVTWDEAVDSKEDLRPTEPLDWKMKLPVPPVAMPGRTKFI